MVIFLPEGFLQKTPLCNAHALFLFPHRTFSCLSTFLCFLPLSRLSTILAEGKLNILSNWHFIHLIFYLAQNCFVCAAVKLVIFGIIACVVQVFTAFHVLVNFVCLNPQPKAVCVCVDELKREAVLPLELIVVKSFISILLSRIVIPA